VGAGVSLLDKKARSLFVRYDGTFAEHGDTHVVTGGLTFKF
jgi:hypothetical protein